MKGVFLVFFAVLGVFIGGVNSAQPEALADDDIERLLRQYPTENYVPLPGKRPFQRFLVEIKTPEDTETPTIISRTPKGDDSCELWKGTRVWGVGLVGQTTVRGEVLGIENNHYKVQVDNLPLQCPTHLTAYNNIVYTKIDQSGGRTKKIFHEMRQLPDDRRAFVVLPDRGNLLFDKSLKLGCLAKKGDTGTLMYEDDYYYAVKLDHRNGNCYWNKDMPGNFALIPKGEPFQVYDNRYQYLWENFLKNTGDATMHVKMQGFKYFLQENHGIECSAQAIENLIDPYAIAGPQIRTIEDILNNIDTFIKSPLQFERYNACYMRYEKENLLQYNLYYRHIINVARETFIEETRSTLSNGNLKQRYYLPYVGLACSFMRESRWAETLEAPGGGGRGVAQQTPINLRDMKRLINGQKVYLGLSGDSFSIGGKDDPVWQEMWKKFQNDPLIKKYYSSDRFDSHCNEDIRIIEDAKCAINSIGMGVMYKMVVQHMILKATNLDVSNMGPHQMLDLWLTTNIAYNVGHNGMYAAIKGEKDSSKWPGLILKWVAQNWPTESKREAKLREAENHLRAMLNCLQNTNYDTPARNDRKLNCFSDRIDARLQEMLDVESVQAE